MYILVAATTMILTYFWGLRIRTQYPQRALLNPGNSERIKWERVQGRLNFLEEQLPRKLFRQLSPVSMITREKHARIKVEITPSGDKHTAEEHSVAWIMEFPVEFGRKDVYIYITVWHGPFCACKCPYAATVFHVRYWLPDKVECSFWLQRMTKYEFDCS